MQHTLRRCARCTRYTLQESCCDMPARPVAPPRYHSEDRYAHYRYELRRKEWKR